MPDDQPEQWERWIGSTAAPVDHLRRGAKVATDPHTRRRWITFRDHRDGVDVVISMPDNAPTGSCDRDRHDDCPHRLGGPQEGGVFLKHGLPGFVWRCGCPCHRDPMRVGRLF